MRDGLIGAGCSGGGGEAYGREVVELAIRGAVGCQPVEVVGQEFVVGGVVEFEFHEHDFGGAEDRT